MFLIILSCLDPAQIRRRDLGMQTKRTGTSLIIASPLDAAAGGINSASKPAQKRRIPGTVAEKDHAARLPVFIADRDSTTSMRSNITRN
jgi:hypothetical protein